MKHDKYSGNVQHRQTNIMYFSIAVPKSETNDYLFIYLH